MADTPSSILLLRLQSTGSNTNLWGGYLNTAMQTQERATKGYQAYTVTGDATVSWSNYSASNDLSVAMAKFGGSPTAAWALTLPSYTHFMGSWNNTNYTGTLKNSAGTGVAIPSGRRSIVYADGTDVGEASPNWLANPATTLVNAGDIVVKTTLETAIANASIPAATGTVLVSAADTTAGYVGTKVTVVGSGAVTVTPTTTNAGASEIKVWTITVPALNLTAQSEQTAGFSATAGKSWPVNISTSGTITFPSSATAGDVIEIDNYGAGVVTFNWNGLKYNGSTTSLAANGKGIALFRYTNAATGWIDL